MSQDAAVVDPPAGDGTQGLLREANRLLLQSALDPMLSRIRAGPGATNLLGAAVVVAARGGSAVELAGELRVDPHTVLPRTYRAGLPLPGRLLWWVRLLLAARILEDRANSVAYAARASGVSEKALRRGTRRLLQLTPRDLRIGGVETVIAGFATEFEPAGRGG